MTGTERRLVERLIKRAVSDLKSVFQYPRLHEEGPNNIRDWVDWADGVDWGPLEGESKGKMKELMEQLEQAEKMTKWFIDDLDGYEGPSAPSPQSSQSPRMPESFMMEPGDPS